MGIGMLGWAQIWCDQIEIVQWAEQDLEPKILFKSRSDPKFYYYQTRAFNLELETLSGGVGLPQPVSRQAIKLGPWKRHWVHTQWVQFTQKREDPLLQELQGLKRAYTWDK